MDKEKIYRIRNLLEISIHAKIDTNYHLKSGHYKRV